MGPIIDNSLNLLVSLQSPRLAHFLELHQDASQVIVKLADLQSLNVKTFTPLAHLEPLIEITSNFAVFDID